MNKNKAFTLLSVVLFSLMLTILPSACSSSPSNSTNVVTISNYMFSPASITVSVGSSVTWKNNDSVTHTVTSDSGLFNSGNLNPGKSYSYTF